MLHWHRSQRRHFRCSWCCTASKFFYLYISKTSRSMLRNTTNVRFQSEAIWRRIWLDLTYAFHLQSCLVQRFASAISGLSGNYEIFSVENVFEPKWMVTRYEAWQSSSIPTAREYFDKEIKVRSPASINIQVRCVLCWWHNFLHRSLTAGFHPWCERTCIGRNWSRDLVEFFWYGVITT